MSFLLSAALLATNVPGTPHHTHIHTHNSDFCEAFVCHSRRCVQSHACECLLRENPKAGAYPVSCIECERNVWEQGVWCHVHQTSGVGCQMSQRLAHP